MFDGGECGDPAGLPAAARCRPRRASAPGTTKPPAGGFVVRSL